MSIQQHSFQNSQLFVSRLIDQCILEKAVRLHMPKKVIYHSCWEDTKNIQNSIINIAKASPDCFSSQIHQNPDIKRNPTIFKVKQKHKPSSSSIITKKSLCRRQNPSDKTQIQMQMNKSKINRTQTEIDIKIHLPRQSLRIQNRFFPNASFYSYNRGKNEGLTSLYAKARQKQLRQAEANEEIIRTLRQVKLNENRESYDKNNHCQSLDNQKRQGTIKRLKQASPKKLLVVTTDYDGGGVRVRKGQLAKTNPHYVDVQVEILDTDKKFNTFSAFEKIRISGEKNLQLNSFPYKQLTFNEIGNKFTANIINRVNKNARKSKLQEILQDGQQSYSKKQIEGFKFSEGRFQPSKVAFSTFERLKKANWSVNRLTQMSKEKKNEIQMSKKSIKNQQKQKQNQQVLMLSGRKNKKKQTINLGSQHALNYLLNDKKDYKKKVTIQSQFL